MEPRGLPWLHGMCAFYGRLIGVLDLQKFWRQAPPQWRILPRGGKAEKGGGETLSSGGLDCPCRNSGTWESDSGIWARISLRDSKNAISVEKMYKTAFPKLKIPIFRYTCNKLYGLPTTTATNWTPKSITKQSEFDNLDDFHKLLDFQK